MRKTLRYSLLLILSLFVGNGVFAADKTVIDLTGSTTAISFSDFSKVGSSYTTAIQGAFPASDGNSYSGWSKTDCCYNSETKTLLQMKKSSGVLTSPTVKSDKGFTVKVTYGAAKGISLQIGDETVSGEAGGSADDQTQTVEISTTSTETTFTINSGAKASYVKSIEITPTGEGGDTPVDTRIDANLSFSTNTASATVGEDFTPPTLSNPSNVSVYYSSSNGEVATVTLDGEVTLKGAGTTTITASVYESDKVYKGSASYTLTVAAPQVVPTVTLPYEEEFKGVGKGKFYIEDVNKGDLSYVWDSDSQYGMKASAFVSNTSHATESWLISPLIDLTNATDPIFTFDHAVNQFTSIDKAKDEATVWVRVGEDGEWYQVSNVTYPSSLGWSFVNAGELPLDEFVGDKIQIGFKYTSTAAKAGTWEIQKFKVNDGEIVITYDAMTVAELCELTKAQDNINLTFTDALVTYVQGKSAYIREGENAICAYDLGIALKEGQTINGSVKVNFELYRGMHEIKANTATTDSVLTITDAAAGATVAPTKATLSELLKGKHAADYIVLRGVQIISEEAASGAKGLNGATAETTTYYAADEAGAKIQLFSPSDDITAKANDGKKYDIEAIFAGAGTNKNITPLAISETTAINNITTDEALKQNTPIYNLAGQRVGESYKGIVIVNGKKIKK